MKCFSLRTICRVQRFQPFPFVKSLPAVYLAIWLFDHACRTIGLINEVAMVRLSDLLLSRPFQRSECADSFTTSMTRPINVHRSSPLMLFDFRLLLQVRWRDFFGSILKTRKWCGILGPITTKSFIQYSCDNTRKWVYQPGR